MKISFNEDGISIEFDIPIECSGCNVIQEKYNPEAKRKMFRKLYNITIGSKDTHKLLILMLYSTSIQEVRDKIISEAFEKGWLK